MIPARALQGLEYRRSHAYQILEHRVLRFFFLREGIVKSFHRAQEDFIFGREKVISFSKVL